MLLANRIVVADVLGSLCPSVAMSNRIWQYPRPVDPPSDLLSIACLQAPHYPSISR